MMAIQKPVRLWRLQMYVLQQAFHSSLLIYSLLADCHRHVYCRVFILQPSDRLFDGQQR